MQINESIGISRGISRSDYKGIRKRSDAYIMSLSFYYPSEIIPYGIDDVMTLKMCKVSYSC